MGPPWYGQGTVPHTTLSVLLSTDILVSPPGVPVGAGEETCYALHDEVRYYNWCVVPAVKVLVEEAIVLLLPLLPNTAVILTLQLLPEFREEMV